MYKGRLFVVSGPSGAGKGTICRELTKEIRISLSVSMTTRDPRPGEREGRSYYFVTKEAFEQSIAAGDLLEYAQVYGQYYGTPKQRVLSLLEAGEDIILEIDTQGAMQVREHFPEGVFIFILPPSMAALRKRLLERGTETMEAANERLGKAMKEISFVNKYDYCIINDFLPVAVARIKSIVIAEHYRVSPHVYDVIEKYKEEM